MSLIDDRLRKLEQKGRKEWKARDTARRANRRALVKAGVRSRSDSSFPDEIVVTAKTLHQAQRLACAASRRIGEEITIDLPYDMGGNWIVRRSHTAPQGRPHTLVQFKSGKCLTGSPYGGKLSGARSRSSKR